MKNLLMRFLLMLFVAIPLLSHSQVDKSNYSLLWEISGNDLQKPSYLFGTMHVRDKRAFEFSDSVLLKLEQSDALALEIQPDTLMKVMMELAISGDTTNSLKEWLSPEAYEKLNGAINEKTGKSIEELDVKDPMWIEQLLSDFEEPKHTEKMDQFVDLYFYKIAYLQQKSILGLERISDYDNVTRSFFKLFEKPDSLFQEDMAEEEALYDQMLELYRNGDLEKIKAWVDAHALDADFEYEMLDRRNINMVNRLAGYARQQSTFFAVGAAHLPGERGMINLLQEKGYTVRKVVPTFTGVAKRYKIKGDGPTWTSFDHPDKGYRFDLPGPPINLVPQNVRLTGLMDGFLYFDMMEMNGMVVSAVALPEPQNDPKDRDAMVMEILKEWQDGQQFDILKSKKLKRAGYEGKDLIVRSADGGYLRWQIFTHPNFIYLFGVYREDKKLDNFNIDKFFSSIQLYPAEAKTWAVFYNKEGAYRVRFPSEPSLIRRVNPVEIDGKNYDLVINSYISPDPENFSNYLVRYNDFPGGTSIEDDQYVLKANLEQFYAQFGDPIQVDSTIQVNGHPGRKAVFSFKDLRIEMRIYLQGVRVYYVMSQTPEGASTAQAEQFFESFHIEPFTYMPLQEKEIFDGTMSIHFPGDFKKEITPAYQYDYPQILEEQYYSTDTLSGAFYLVAKYHYSPYFEVENWEEYLKEMGEIMTEEEGVVYLKDTLFRNTPAWQIAFSDSTTRTTNYNLVFFSGRHLYEMITYLPEAGMEKQAWQFFNSFSFMDPSEDPAVFYTKNKKEALFAALSSTDSLTLTQAKHALNYHEFDSSHLPSIYTLLEKENPVDTMDYRTTSDILLDILITTNDESTVPFLKKRYASSHTSPDLREKIIETLANIGTDASLDAFFKLAHAFPLDTLQAIYSYNLYSSFWDSLELTQRYLPQLMQLYQKKAFQWGLYQLITNYLEAEEGTDPQAVTKQLDFILADATEKKKEYLEYETAGNPMDYVNYWDIAEILKLLTALQAHKKANQFLEEAQQFQDPYLLSLALAALIKNEQEVDAEALDKVFGEPENWYYLLNTLDKHDQLDQLPAHLLDQKVAAKAYVAAYFDSEYSTLGSLEFIGEQPFEYDNAPVNLYVFSFTFAGSDETSLGIVSQPADKEKIQVNPDIFDYSHEEYEEEKKKELLEGLLKNWVKN